MLRDGHPCSFRQSDPQEVNRRTCNPCDVHQSHLVSGLGGEEIFERRTRPGDGSSRTEKQDYEMGPCSAILENYLNAS